MHVTNQVQQNAKDGLMGNLWKYFVPEERITQENSLAETREKSVTSY
jgi:hypothetical protein